MRFYQLLVILTLFFSVDIFSQTDLKEVQDVKYRRSSLNLTLLEADSFPNRDIVLEAYNNAPFPEKYNNHSVDFRTFKLDDYALNEGENDAAQKLASRSKLGGKMLKMISGSTEGIVNVNDYLNPYIIKKALQENKVANQMIAKWFNRQEDGSFNMDLISERGFYDATEMAASIAKASARGTSSLGDAGEELINNTFIVVTKLNFVSNEVFAAIIRDKSIKKINKLPMEQADKDSAIVMVEALYEVAKEGYSVWTLAYLYQLNWDDSTAAVFYNDYWVDKNNYDSLKVVAFDTSQLFQFNYIGFQNARNIVTAVGKSEGVTEDDLIARATIRNQDAVLAKLQKKYDVFKTKTPLIQTDPPAARIGMKEGVEPNDKFEVLEQTFNTKTGKTEYKKVCVIKADRKQIWDNRFVAGQEVSDSTSTENNYTVFKGGKKMYEGMLIRQIK